MVQKPFSLSVKVVIMNSAAECLVLRRSQSSKFNAGKWEFPGGKIDVGERFDEALLREVLEETGLTITLDRVAGCSESELPERKVAYIIMQATPLAGEFVLSTEHDAFNWVDRSKLPTVDLAQQFVAFAHEFAAEV